MARHGRFRRIVVVMTACVSLWLLVVVLAACGQTSLACTPVGQGDIRAGEVIFGQNEMCATCHPGGNAGVGPAIRGIALEQAQVAGVIRNGKGNMHGYSAARLSDAQVCQVAAYVKSFK